MEAFFSAKPRKSGQNHRVVVRLLLERRIGRVRMALSPFREEALPPGSRLTGLPVQELLVEHRVVVGRARPVLKKNA
jgi:hypothetical protein